MLPKVEKTKRNKTPEQALKALMRLASRAEKSSGDAMRLMAGWGVEPSQRQSVLDKLIAMKFIDDRRYADAFVRDKLRFSGWGAYKIRTALRGKGISQQIIDEVLSQADGAEMKERLQRSLATKMKSVKYSSPYDLRNKLMRYGASLGYDFDVVADAVAGIVKAED